AEPRIRVALATDVRSATISTTGKLMNASDGGSTLIALDTSGGRVEPRLLSPLPVSEDEGLFRLSIAGVISEEEADQTAREVRKLTGKETQITLDVETNTWGVLGGGRHAREEVEELRARLEDSGFAASVIPVSQKAVENTATGPTRREVSQISNVKLTSRTI